MLSVSAAALLPCPAIAQPAATDAGSAAAPATEGGLEDIIVTARKRTESAQNVPVAITAFSAEMIAHRDLTTLENISAATPNLVIGRAASGSGATMVLRGIGSNSSSIGIEQSIAVIVDGVYFGQGRVINEGFFDLAHAEILKGPQALFYGKNATAGVISLKTADPSNKLEVIARTGYEFKSENVIGEVIASGPLSETLGLRVAVKASNMFGGYFKNLADTTTYTTINFVTGASTVHTLEPTVGKAPQIKEIIGRATLQWEPTNRLTATLKASGNINNSKVTAWNYVLFNCPTGASALNPAVKCGKDFVINQSNLPTGIIGDTTYLGGNGRLRNDYSAWQVTPSVEYHGADIILTGVANYNWNKNWYVCDCDFTVTNGPGAFGTEKAYWRAFSFEGRALTAYDGPLNAMFGVYYQKSRREYHSSAIGARRDNPNAPRPEYRFVTNVKDSKTNGETIAVFGQVIWKMLNNLEFTVGARYTHETKDSYFLHVYAHPLNTNFDPTRTIVANQVFDNWSPEAMLSYKPSKNVTLYGGYRTAYKSGGFSNSGIVSRTATVDDFAFDPETVKGFEGGIKTTLLDRQLRLNLALFRYNYSNLQIDFFNSPIFAFSTINAGGVITKGAELDFEYAPRAVSGLTLRGAINYNKARYRNFGDAPCWGGQSIAAGCNIPPPPRPRHDLSGTPTANAPEWTGALGVSYDTAISDRLNLGLAVDGRYSDSYIASAFGNPNARQSSYATLDASARLSTADGHWELAVIGKNLTNQFYVNGSFDAPLTGSGTGTANARPADVAGFAALPRTVQLNLTWKY